jgi:hypothetical protein
VLPAQPVAAEKGALSKATPPSSLPSAKAAATTAASSGSRSSSTSGPVWMQKTGAFQVLQPWQSSEAGALCVQQGTALWVTSTDDSGEWAYARMMVPSSPSAGSAHSEEVHAWVPRAVLQRAIYTACSVFDAAGQAQGLTLRLGDLVHVYHREASGWTYGARLERLSTNGVAAGSAMPEESGWFPEACIGEALVLT